MTIDIGANDVLIVVDMQYDFLPGGPLGAPGADHIIPLINALATRFANVVLTQDWHPPGHVSLASSHPGRQPFETIELSYGPQVLWPDHCLWGTHGAEISAEIVIPHAQLIIRKGYNRDVDSYSGFQEADRKTHTGLAGYLKERAIDRVFVTGVATDFCVGWTALDAQSAGLQTAVIEDATRGIDTNGSMHRAWANMTTAGINRLQSNDILAA
ncbi:nicotinamidase [uncultured Devosia sp.]|uniref:nicotinamidase n=1 Tax=uncultured Devosia sp. TaxID=211434 RepID=UPI0035CA87B1